MSVMIAVQDTMIGNEIIKLFKDIARSLQSWDIVEKRYAMNE